MKTLTGISRGAGNITDMMIRDHTSLGTVLGGGTVVEVTEAQMQVLTERDPVDGMIAEESRRLALESLISTATNVGDTVLVAKLIAKRLS